MCKLDAHSARSASVGSTAVAFRIGSHVANRGDAGQEKPETAFCIRHSAFGKRTEI